MKIVYLLLMILIVQPSMAAEDPVGEFYCEGLNSSGGGRYKGTAKVTANGENYQLVWKIQGQTHVGTGLMTGDVFSAAFSANPGHFGVAVYRRDGDSWYGRWTEAGSTVVGTETWKKIDTDL